MGKFVTLFIFSVSFMTFACTMTSFANIVCICFSVFLFNTAGMIILLLTELLLFTATHSDICNNSISLLLTNFFSKPIYYVYTCISIYHHNISYTPISCNIIMYTTLHPYIPDNKAFMHNEYRFLSVTSL